MLLQKETTPRVPEGWERAQRGDSAPTGTRSQLTAQFVSVADGHILRTSRVTVITGCRVSHQGRASGSKSKTKPLPQDFSLQCKFIFVGFSVSTKLLVEL